MWKLRFIAGSTLLLAFFGPGIGHALPSQAIDKHKQTCARAVQVQERQGGIPLYLLKAISLAESGRWDPRKQANIAWPWTVTSGGKGRFFETKAEAVAEVEILMTQGVRNIDVGCMQINLHYHGDKFDTVEQAFDPAINTAAAANYLKAMHRKTGNWVMAAGAYHSTTPNLARKYRAKVLKHWNAARQLPPPPASLTASLKPGQANAISNRKRSIDYGRVAKLNKSFRKRRGIAQAAATAKDKTDRRKQFRQAQLQSWRQSQAAPGQLAQLAAMRRAEIKQRKKREYVTFGNGDQTPLFEQRRRQQLNDWRLKRVIPFGPEKTP